MRGAVLGFLVGVALLQTRAALPPLSLLALLAVAAAGLGFAAHKSARAGVRICLLVTCGAVAGFAWSGLLAQRYLAEELPLAWEGRDVMVVGTIESLPVYLSQGVRFDFAVERILDENAGAQKIPRRLALSWHASLDGEGAQTVGKLSPGERWQFNVRLRRPHGNANPDGFDYEAWLLEQRIRATGYVRPQRQDKPGNLRLDTFVFSFDHAVQRTRAWLRDRIHAALPDKEYAGVIAALVIGDQREVSQSDWKVFNRTGVGHLISISGLHITMLAGLAAGLIFSLWRRSFLTRANLPLLLPAQKAAALAGACAALVYVLLAGFGVPAQRTLYMLSVVAVALWFGRIASVSHVLCIALGVVLLIDPWAVLWPGFWLSFGAVGIILYATAGRTRVEAGEPPAWSEAPSAGGSAAGPPAAGPPAATPTAVRISAWKAGLRAAAHTQYVVTLGLVPLGVLLFGQVSLIGPLANAIAIPVISFFVTPLALAGSVMPSPLSAWLLRLAHLGVEWLALLLRWLSDMPLAVWAMPVPAWWMFLLALAGSCWMLAPRGWPARWLGLLLWLPLLLNAPARPEAGEMWVTAFDVGQGTALLIETRSHRLLYDTGPAYSPESDGGNRVILPYLRARGINALDGVVVSHSDSDHAGGALSIFDEIRVGWVASSLPAAHPVARAAPAHRRCEAGQAWEWDGVRFAMLHPDAAGYEREQLKPNARSCTLRLALGSHALLLPGDIEAPQEKALLAHDPEALRADVLIAPHHGSGTSSTPPFLQAVKPDIAIFQVGYRNRYHHPKPEVFARYGALGIRRLRSDDAGAVTLRIRGDAPDSLQVSAYREAHARYWYGK